MAILIVASIKHFAPYSVMNMIRVPSKLFWRFKTVFRPPCCACCAAPAGAPCRLRTKLIWPEIFGGDVRKHLFLLLPPKRVGGLGCWMGVGGSICPHLGVCLLQHCGGGRAWCWLLYLEEWEEGQADRRNGERNFAKAPVLPLDPRRTCCCRRRAMGLCACAAPCGMWWRRTSGRCVPLRCFACAAPVPSLCTLCVPRCPTAGSQTLPPYTNLALLLRHRMRRLLQLAPHLPCNCRPAHLFLSHRPPYSQPTLDFPPSHPAPSHCTHQTLTPPLAVLPRGGGLH